MLISPTSGSAPRAPEARFDVQMAALPIAAGVFGEWKTSAVRTLFKARTLTSQEHSLIITACRQGLLTLGTAPRALTIYCDGGNVQVNAFLFSCLKPRLKAMGVEITKDKKLQGMPLATFQQLVNYFHGDPLTVPQNSDQLATLIHLTELSGPAAFNMPDLLEACDRILTSCTAPGRALSWIHGFVQFLSPTHARTMQTKYATGAFQRLLKDSPELTKRLFQVASAGCLPLFEAKIAESIPYSMDYRPSLLPPMEHVSTDSDPITPDLRTSLLSIVDRLAMLSVASSSSGGPSARERYLSEIAPKTLFQLFLLSIGENLDKRLPDLTGSCTERLCEHFYNNRLTREEALCIWRLGQQHTVSRYCFSTDTINFTTHTNESVALPRLACLLYSDQFRGVPMYSNDPLVVGRNITERDFQELQRQVQSAGSRPPPRPTVQPRQPELPPQVSHLKLDHWPTAQPTRSTLRQRTALLISGLSYVSMVIPIAVAFFDLLSNPTDESSGNSRSISAILLCGIGLIASLLPKWNPRPTITNAPSSWIAQNLPSRLKSLDLSSCTAHLTNHDINALVTHCRDLERITIGANAQDWGQLSRLGRLKELTIHVSLPSDGRAFSPAELAFLQTVPACEEVKICCQKNGVPTQPSAQTIDDILRACPNVTHLTGRSFLQSTEAIEQGYGSRLRSLGVSSAIGPGGFEMLADRCKQLEELSLYRVNLTDVDQLALKQHCPNLRHLQLIECIGVTDDYLNSLAQSLNLESLTVIGHSAINSSPHTLHHMTCLGGPQSTEGAIKNMLKEAAPYQKQQNGHLVQSIASSCTPYPETAEALSGIIDLLVRNGMRIGPLQRVLPDAITRLIPWIQWIQEQFKLPLSGTLHIGAYDITNAIAVAQKYDRTKRAIEKTIQAPMQEMFVKNSTGILHAALMGFSEAIKKSRFSVVNEIIRSHLNTYSQIDSQEIHNTASICIAHVERWIHPRLHTVFPEMVRKQEALTSQFVRFLLNENDGEPSEIVFEAFRGETDRAELTTCLETCRDQILRRASALALQGDERTRFILLVLLSVAAHITKTSLRSVLGEFSPYEEGTS